VSDERKASVGVAFGIGRRPDEASAPVPFRCLVLADFGGATARERPQPIDKDGLAAALAGAGVQIPLRVPNRLDTAPATLDATVTIAAFKDFTPARLAAQIPELAAAQALRQKLAAFMAGTLGADQLRAALSGVAGVELVVAAVRQALAAPAPPAVAPAQSPPPPSPAGNDDLDRLLDMVDTHPPTKPDAPPTASPLIAAMLDKTRSQRAVPGAAALLLRVEQLIAAQLEAVLADARFAAIEAAWLGLRFLIRRADFRAPIQVERIDVTKDEAADLILRLASSAAATDGGTPLAAIILAHDFELTAADIGRLGRLAEAGEESMAPVVAGLGNGIFRTDDMTEIARLRDPGSRIEAVGGDPWNALRDKPGARWLMAVANPIAVRNAAAAAELGFTEVTTALGLPCWGNPAWAVASLLLASMARIGWPTEIAGRDAGKVENLDLVVREIAGTAMQLAVALPIGIEAASGLADAGVACLAGERDRDAAWLVRAPSVHRSAHVPGDDGRLARLFASFPYQLAAARLVRAIADEKPALAESEPAAVAAALEAALRRLLQGTGPGASAKVAAATDTDDDARLRLQVAVHTGTAVLGGAAFHLDLPL